MGKEKPTTTTLQLADRSFKHLRGIIEDALVKVDKFIFPIDFIVLDMEEDKEIPIKLGRPFLATGRAIINVQKGELKLRVKGEEVVFNVFKGFKHPCDETYDDNNEKSYDEILHEYHDEVTLSKLTQMMSWKRRVVKFTTKAISSFIHLKKMRNFD